MAAIATVISTVRVADAATIDNVVVRMGLPEGQGLSGVCLFKNGPDDRRRVMFKSVTSARKKHGGGDYMVAGDLVADRVYEGTFARLEDGDQVARFECKGGQRFEIATPFVVPERDLDTMLTVKESMERRFGAQPSRQQPRRFVMADHVSVTLRVLQRRPTSATAADSGDYIDDDASVTVDVFQLYKKPTAPENLWNSKATGTAAQYSAFPFARYALRYPVGKLMLDDLPPDQMLAVKLRRPVTLNNDNLTENAIFIYTGGLYPRGTANLTKMLDDGRAEDDTAAAADHATDTDVAATSMQILAKHVHRDSFGKCPTSMPRINTYSYFTGITAI